MITTKEMKEAETSAEELGVTKLELMENAGRQVAEVIEEKFGDKLKDKKVIIVCGPGNNGGDGFVVARFLYDICKVEVLFLGDKDFLPNEASVNYEQLEGINKHIIFPYNSEIASSLNLAKYDIIIDAMFGMGLRDELGYPYSIITKHINTIKSFVISIDIPTGVNADSGKTHNEVYINPDLIITFHDTKPGLKHFEKKVKIVDIGIPF